MHWPHCNIKRRFVSPTRLKKVTKHRTWDENGKISQQQSSLPVFIRLSAVSVCKKAKMLNAFFFQKQHLNAGIMCDRSSLLRDFWILSERLLVETFFSEVGKVRGCCVPPKKKWYTTPPCWVHTWVSFAVTCVPCSFSMFNKRTLLTCLHTCSLEPGPSRARYFPRDMLLLTTTARRQEQPLAREGPGSRLCIAYVALDSAPGLSQTWQPLLSPKSLWKQNATSTRLRNCQANSFWSRFVAVCVLNDHWRTWHSVRLRQLVGRSRTHR